MEEYLNGFVGRLKGEEAKTDPFALVLDKVVRAFNRLVDIPCNEDLAKIRSIIYPSNAQCIQIHWPYTSTGPIGAACNTDDMYELFDTRSDQCLAKWLDEHAEQTARALAEVVKEKDLRSYTLLNALKDAL